MSANSKDWIRMPMRIAVKQSAFKNKDVYETLQRFTLAFDCNAEQLNHIFKGVDPEDPDIGEFIEELNVKKLWMNM